MKRTVWYIAKYIAPPMDGTAGGRAFMIMRELARAGIDVTIIGSDSNQLTPVPVLKTPYLLQDLDGVRMLWLRTAKYRVAKSFRRIWSWLDFEYRLLRAPLSALPKPETIVVSSLSLFTVLNGIRLRRKYRARLVFEVRDIWPLTLVAEAGFSQRNPLIRLLSAVERLGYLMADEIVGTMPNLSEHVADILGRERMVHCVPMGLDVMAYSQAVPLPEEYIRQHFPKGKFVVAHVGTIGITNALDTFVECARRLEDDTSIHFLFVGDGDLRDRYEVECRGLRNIGFAPKVAKNAVQSVLSRCDLVYFSTFKSEVWRYGQSLNKVIDYMYSGTPVVASYGGYPSMIDEAECGSFVPPGDAAALAAEIRRYAAMSPAERAEIGARGKAWLLENRTFPRLARDYARILFSDSPFRLDRQRMAA
jgi:glycosyltransferase involved in cell wall biosynthesis